MTEALDSDYGLRVNEEGEDADCGEDDEEDGGGRCDCALHDCAVGGNTRFKGHWSDEGEDKGEEGVDPGVVVVVGTIQVKNHRHGETESHQCNETDDSNTVVAEECEDDGEGEESEDDVGEEVDRGLQPLHQLWLPSVMASSYPPVTAALSGP